jgi:uncharacterized membrane protein
MRALSTIFGKGLLTVLPIMITLYLLFWIAGAAENFFGQPLRQVFPEAPPGLGLAIALVLIFFVGLALNNYIASRFMIWLEKGLESVPVFKAIYSPVRDVMSLFSRGDQAAPKRVVMVDFQGAKVMGLITRDRFDDFQSGTIPPDHVTVLVPLSYMVGGITIIVPKTSVREINVSPERAMQLAVTAWVKNQS